MTPYKLQLVHSLKMSQRDQSQTSFQINLIFNLVGTLISKITLFGAQKSHMWSYRSQRTHYDRLFSADCERRHYRYVFIWKWGRRNHYGQWRHLWHQDNSFSWYWWKRCLVTGHISHATIDLFLQTFAGRFISSQLTAKKLWFATFVLLYWKHVIYF